MNRRDFIKSSSTALAAGAVFASLPRLAFGTAAADQPAQMRFGVNYVPRKRWWYCWLDWDQAAIADDLGGIAGLGLDHIRIQCLWPFFQPGINMVSDRVLANLYSLLEAADQAGLDVEITVLNGWMSGLSFLPAWAGPLANKEDRNRNIFTSPEIIEAERLLFRKLAETVGRHKRFLGFDIGNELGCLIKKNNHATMKEADAWATDLLRYCDEIAPGKFHINGVDHSHWFNDFGFSRPQLGKTGHASVVHAYIYFTGVLKLYKYNDPASLHLADYMIELAYAYHTDLNRRVWVEEIGVGDIEMPESYKPEFMEQTVRNIAATGKAWGITWWCSHDIDPANKDFGSYEYGLGLLDLNNQPKPMGQKFASLIKEFKKSPPNIAPRKTALVIPDQGLTATAWPPDWKFATLYMNLIKQGETPAIVLEGRAKDAAYLKARGISDLIPLPPR